MEPSVYDTDLIGTAIHNLDHAAEDLPGDGTGSIQWYQSSRKWGFQPQPVNFKKQYSERLDYLNDRISKAKDNVQALRDALTSIQHDVCDTDLACATIANQIAANRTVADQPSSNQ